MPNPNFSEFVLKASYGPDATDLQETEIYNSVAEDGDQIDHKYVENVFEAGMYVELAHYLNINRIVKQVVIQNTSAATVGVVHWVDATTGAIVPDFVLPGEHISINNPDVTIGIMLYAAFAQEVTSWHLAICGGIA